MRFEQFRDDERVQVWILGQPEPISILRKNIMPLVPKESDYGTSKVLDLGNGIGRRDIREDKWKAIVNVNQVHPPLIVSERMIESADEWPRFKGSVTVIAEALPKLDQENKLDNKSVLMHVTDLNLAHAINLLASGERVVENEAWGPGWKKLVKFLTKKLKKDNLVLMARYSPHRVKPDLFTSDRFGTDRARAVRAGAYHIYPCSYFEYLDALEVRFSFSSGSKHEIWLDYGPVETKGYVENAFALDATDRLYPEILAQVDPQAFWSAILHYETFMTALRSNLAPESKLLTEWIDLKKGFDKSHADIREIEKEMEMALLPDERGKWAITNENDHYLIGLRNAQAAIVATFKRGKDDGIVQSADSKFEILDYYRGTQIEKDIFAVDKAAKSSDPSEVTRIITLLMVGLPTDSADVCATCGNPGGLSLCSRCQCIAYCCRECQKRDWKSHKSLCTKIHGDETLKVRLYRPRSSLPTKQCMFSEVSGIGSLSIFWSGTKGVPNFINHNSGHYPVADLSGATSNQMLKFEDLRELNPLWRFTLTCGPLPSLDTAKACLDEALKMVGGDPRKLRVESAGFTALEWAAKKGNKATVEWLCQDDRTKILVSVGSPIGWAAYTGKVEIMRILLSYGADAGATDEVLWQYQQPFLVAASNGQLEAMKFLIDECGQDISMCDRAGRGVLANIEESPTWKELEGHRSAHKWAKKKLAERNG